MLIILSLMTSFFLQASMLDVDRPWNNQFNAGSTPYDPTGDGSKKSEFDTLRDILKTT
jgi:hypothetical protein